MDNVSPELSSNIASSRACQNFTAISRKKAFELRFLKVELYLWAECYGNSFEFNWRRNALK